MSNPVIRPETPSEYTAMESLIRDAFWDVYHPGAAEHLLVHNLRNHPACLRAFCFAAELDGKLAGGIWYAVSAIKKPDGRSLAIPSLGPIAVAPEFQKRGIGSALIRHTLPLVRAAGHPGVALFGDPAYYGRFGFEPGQNAGLAASDGNFYDVLQVVRFRPEVDLSGRYQEGDAYRFDEAELEAFDAQFPPREKHVLPGQLP